ncbi:hypothetical protein I6F11_23370 [Ensifer sp. NBAIM29]|nr:hypothetical protein [Ensifer sp. NBAIM29]
MSLTNVSNRASDFNSQVKESTRQNVAVFFASNAKHLDDGEYIARDYPHLFPNGLRTTWDSVQEPDFVSTVETALRNRFDNLDPPHRPSDEHWRGLRSIIRAIWDMAHGDPAPKLYLSSLPAGIGKTSAVEESVRELIAYGERTGKRFGVVIMTNVLDQIPKMVKAMGLREDQYAVRTGSKGKAEGYNDMGLGSDNANRAQVLFTTQQSLTATTLHKGVSFEQMYHLAYENKPRPVRIWDEGIVPAEPYVLSIDDIDRLKRPLSEAGFESLRNELDRLTTSMREQPLGTVIRMPPLEALATALVRRVFEEADKTAAEMLSRMADNDVLLRREERHGTAALFYEEIVPEDLKPLLTLDASGEVRMTYRMMETHRKDIIRLPSAGKVYPDLELNVWDHAAGKTAYRSRKARQELALGVADAVASSTAGKILIVIRKATRAAPSLMVEIEKAIERRIPDFDMSRVKTVTWGKHKATNEFADCTHVIIVGVLQYDDASVETLARASGRLNFTTPVSDDEIRSFHEGEIADHLLQAANRIAIRRANGDKCPPGCRVDLIFSTKSVASLDTVRKVFPGAVIRKWQPLDDLIPSEQALLRVLERSADAEATVSLTELADELDATTRNVTKMLKRPRVLSAMAERGMAVERRAGVAGMRVYRTGGWWIVREAEAKQLDPAMRHQRKLRCGPRNRKGQSL